MAGLVGGALGNGGTKLRRVGVVRLGVARPAVFASTAAVLSSSLFPLETVAKGTAVGLIRLLKSMLITGVISEGLPAEEDVPPELTVTPPNVFGWL